jgi:diguanylate cyclase (GGDEF)-like protein
MEKSRKLKLFLIIFSSLIVVAMGVMVIISIVEKSYKDSEFKLEYSYSVDNQWKDKNGKEVDLTDLKAVPKNGDGTLSIFTELSTKGTEGINLIYRSDDCSTQLYAGTELLYETNRVESMLYDKPIGVRWNLIRIDNENMNKKIEIRIKPAYSDRPVYIDSTYVGDRAKLVLDIINNNIINVLICFIMFIISILLFVYSSLTTIFSKSITAEKDYGLGYLAFFAFITSVWAMIETNTLQLFAKDLNLIEIISKMLVLIAPVPLLFFMDSCYGILKWLVVKVIIVLDLIYISVAIIFQSFKIYDLEQTIFIVYGFYGIIVLLIFVVIICNVKVDSKQRDYKVYFLLQQLGFFFLAISLIADMVRMIFGYTTDKAVIARGGIVVFLMLICIGNVYRIINVIQYGMKTEFVGQLAYSDGLTEVGNRTAYEEKLKSIENRKEGKFGIVMLDVNNLKIVNDNFGHEMGDKLIRYASDLIKDTFGKIGKVYRIGGDEFAVIIFNANPQENYNIYVEDFKEQMDELYKKNEDELPIVVAHGFSWCDQLTENEIKHTVKRADDIMYENKKELKLLYPTYLKDFRKGHL